MSYSAKRRDVVFLLFDGLLLLDVAGPADVFAAANQFGCDYCIRYVSLTGQVSSSAGLRMATQTFAQDSGTIHTIVVPGGTRKGLNAAMADDVLLGWLSNASRSAARIVSVCTGAFLLGKAGLLDGRRATTHWERARELVNEVPSASVDGERLFIEDSPVWTSAGAATGIDLALAIVARDAGSGVALAVARDLVLHLVRPGGQSQFSAPLAFQAREGGDLSGLIPWLEAHLHGKVTVAEMADAIGMSPRTFHRRCLDEFGQPPARLVATLRLDRARLLLGDFTLPIGLVAHRAGFADAASFSKAFSAQYGTTPSAYRRAFAEHPSRQWVARHASG